MAEKIGVLVASDKEQKWLLPWWYHYYKQNNTLPIAFVDLGLSKRALSWCEKKGHVISLKDETNFISNKEEVDPLLHKAFEKTFC